MVAVIGAVVPLAVVNAGTLPDPLAASPIAVLLFVQVKAVPLTGPDKVVSGALTPEQYVWLLTAITVGVGLTVIVKEDGVPAQFKLP
jgi:hypothetical protein